MFGEMLDRLTKALRVRAVADTRGQGVARDRLASYSPGKFEKKN